MRTVLLGVLFLGCGSPDPQTPTQQSHSCQQMLACAAVAAPLGLAALQEGYGQQGSCWRDGVSAANCDQACQSALKMFRLTAADEPACGCNTADDCYDKQLRCVGGKCVKGSSCEDYLSCEQDCTTTACVDDCTAAASEPAIALLDEAYRCADGVCTIMFGGPCHDEFDTSDACYACYDDAYTNACAAKVQACLES